MIRPGNAKRVAIINRRYPDLMVCNSNFGIYDNPEHQPRAPAPGFARYQTQGNVRSLWPDQLDVKGAVRMATAASSFN
jgi:hypothetical protein